MKLLFDFFPILLFFLTFKFYGIYAATAAAIAASFLQVIAVWLKTRKVETMHLVTLALITVLGGATLWLQDELFIKWKPTAINWLFAIVFAGSHFIGNKPLIRHMMENNVILPDLIWTRLNISWVSFFTVMGFANLYVIYHYDTNTWVNFKLFGMLGLTLLFVILQAVYLTRHVIEKESEPST